MRKLSSSLRPIEQLPGLMRYLGEGGSGLRVFGEEDVAVVVEVTDDGGVSNPWR